MAEDVCSESGQCLCRAATPSHPAQRKERFPASKRADDCRGQRPATRCESPCRQSLRPARLRAGARMLRDPQEYSRGAHSAYLDQMTVVVKDLRLDANLHAAKACARLGFALARGCFAIHKNIRVVHIALISGPN